MSAGEELLTPGAREAVKRARRLSMSYAVRLLVTADAEPRLLVVVGEAHLKLAEASRVGKALVAEFELRGVETFPAKDVLAGRALSVLIKVPRLALRAATLGFVKGSTITEALALGTGHTEQLEKGHTIPVALHAGSLYLAAFFAVGFAQAACVWGASRMDVAPDGIEMLTTLLTLALALFELHLPWLVPAWLLRRHTWSWLLHPMIAILTVRDAMMAEGTMRMLREHPGPRTAVVVMGRAHLPGYTRVLVEKHGMRRIS